MKGSGAFFYAWLLLYLKNTFELRVVYNPLEGMIDVSEVVNELLLEGIAVLLLDGMHHADVLGDNVYTVVHPLVITSFNAQGETTGADIVNVMSTSVLLYEFLMLQLVEEVMKTGVRIGELNEFIEADHILLLLHHMPKNRKKWIQQMGIVRIHHYTGFKDLAEIAYLAHTVHIDAAHEAAALWL